jgi:integrase
MREIIGYGLLKVQHIAPRAEPLQEAKFEAYRGLGRILDELLKGDNAHPLVVKHQDRLRTVYAERLNALGNLSDALGTRADDDRLYDALANLPGDRDAIDRPLAQPSRSAEPHASARQADTPHHQPMLPRPTELPSPAPMTAPDVSARHDVPSTPEGPATPPVLLSRMPLFSKVSQDYIDMRIAADGEDHKEIKYLRLRRRTWLGIIGDKPVDEIKPSDMQRYVNEMQCWPANVTKRAGMVNVSVKEILEANKDRHIAPLNRKTLEDGYVANVKTMIRHGMLEYDYRDPIAGMRIRWPSQLAPSRPREAIGADVINATFQLGVASGLLAEAILPLLAYTTSRRLGLLCFLRGEDIRPKHGVYVAQTGGIVCDKGSWKRVPYKTTDSLAFFVLHDKLVETGLVDWMMRQEGFIFEALQEYKDPAKETSKYMNRLLRRAGAAGDNIEVFHCFRHGEIDNMRQRRIDPRARRLQSGHELGDGLRT